MNKRIIPLILSVMFVSSSFSVLAEDKFDQLQMKAPVNTATAVAPVINTTLDKGNQNADSNPESTVKGAEKDTKSTDKAKKRERVDTRKLDTVALPEMPPMPPMPGASNEFSEALKESFPLTPNQIRQLRRALDESQRAKSDTPSVPAKPVTTTMLIKSDPGATPPVARLGLGFVSSVVFVDSSGAPWPVSSVSIGDPGKFTVEQAGKDEAGTNVLTITPQSAYMHSNLVVMLKGRNTPVMITIVSGQSEVDYRIDASVDGRGPNAAAPLISGDIKLMSNPALQEVLDGLTPKKSKELKVTGVDARAFALNGMIYLRSRASILSPAWSAHVSSPDGMHVYQIPEVPVVLALVDGHQVQLNIEGISWQNK